MPNQKRRNVLFFISDQLRADFLNAYGGDFIPTPNIDALAANGVVYDNAITAATVCGPARMSFLTGEFVSGHDAWTNQISAREGTVFLPERLNDAGYMTAAVGQFDHEPLDGTFGYKYKTIACMGGVHDDHEKWLKARHPECTKWCEKDENGYFKYGQDEHFDAWSADRAIEFIETYTKTGKAPNGAAPENENAPFYLYCGFLWPHGPEYPPTEAAGTVDPNKIPPVKFQPRPDEDIPSVELYRRAFLNPPEAWNDPDAWAENVKKRRIKYAECVVEVDRQIGRVIEALKDNGIYEDTTIILTADHGSQCDDYLMSTKGPWPYRHQLFIPMIISNHPGLEPGSRCDALCGNLDIGATLLDIAGDKKVFGVSRSMIGLANGSVQEREVNMSEFSDSQKTIVDKRYTFSYYPFTGKTCLFDRIADPDESVNLSGRSEYAELERKFLMHTVDFMILAKGIRIEAHDLVPDVQEGIAKKHPDFLDNLDIAYPIASMNEIEHLKWHGLDTKYNEFCKTHPIKAHYGVYFTEKKK